MLLQVHESAINNSENWIAGQTIGDSDFRELVFETFGMLAAQEQPEAQIPATITFADEQPLEARIADGRLDVALRLKAFSCGGMTFDGRVWTVRTSYQPQFAGGKVALVRTAPISVQSDSASGVEMLQSALARFLIDRAVSGLSSNPSLATLPPLAVGQLSMEQGWFTLAMTLDAQNAAAGRVAARQTSARQTSARQTSARQTSARQTSSPLTSRPLPAAILTAFTRRTYRNLAMNVTRFSLLVACLMLCTVSSAAERTQFASSTRPPQAETLADKKLLLSFQGKGSSLAWDAGVVKRAYEVASAWLKTR